MNRIYVICLILCLYCIAAVELSAQNAEPADSTAVPGVQAGISSVSLEEGPDIIDLSLPDKLPAGASGILPSPSNSVIPYFYPSFGYVPVYAQTYSLGLGNRAFIPVTGNLGFSLGSNFLDLTGFYNMTMQEVGAGIRLTDRLFLSTGVLFGMQAGFAGNMLGTGNVYGVGARVGMEARVSDRVSLGVWSAYGSPAAFGPVFGPVMLNVPGAGAVSSDGRLKTPMRMSVGAEASFKVGDNMTIGIGASVSTQTP